ncbi:MAG TPA: hypothetical protein VID93_09665, partial [Acidimicrobiales bacterium]
MARSGDHQARALGPRSGAARWAVGVALGLVVLVTAIVLGLRLDNAGNEPEGQNWWLVSELILGLAYLPTGALLVARRDRRRLGTWFMVVGATALASALATQYLGYVQDEQKPVTLPWLASLAGWHWLVGGAVLTTLVLLALLPAPWRADRRVRAVSLVAIAAIVALAVRQL